MTGIVLFEEQVVAMSWVIGLVVVFGPVILVLFVVVIAGRAIQVTKLSHDGVAAAGTVIERFYRGGGQGMASPCLRYEYHGPDGRRYEYRINTDRDFWEAHEVGDTIEIVYVKSKPSISGAKEMVNRCRETLKLPPL
jgi:hypothetical protein